MSKSDELKKLEYLRAFSSNEHNYYMLKHDVFNMKAGTIFVATFEDNFNVYRNTVGKLILCWTPTGGTYVGYNNHSYAGGAFILPINLKDDSNYFIRVNNEEHANIEFNKILANYNLLEEYNPWVSIKDRLPSQEDINANDGCDMFFVTAIYGVNGIAMKSVFPCNFNTYTNSWESCDTEIVTHWMPHTMPKPAED